jgi:uncharacterized membrane protein HdeD (DUF308 family)
MNEARAQEVIVLCLFITLASTSGAELTGLKKAQKLEAKKTIVAGFFAMLLSSILAEFSPSAGAYLAVLVSGVTFFSYGLPTIESYYAPTRVGRKASK